MAERKTYTADIPERLVSVEERFAFCDVLIIRLREEANAQGAKVGDSLTKEQYNKWWLEEYKPRVDAVQEKRAHAEQERELLIKNSMKDYPEADFETSFNEVVDGPEA